MLTTRSTTLLVLTISLLLLQVADAYTNDGLWKRSTPERRVNERDVDIPIAEILKRYAAAHPERFPGVEARDLSAKELTKRYADAHSGSLVGNVQKRDSRGRDSRGRDSRAGRESRRSGRDSRAKDSRRGKNNGRRPDTNEGKSINTGRSPINRSCKKWFTIRDYIMRYIFNGKCGSEARASVRLAFHDAGTYSIRRDRFGLKNGGADGSMLSDPSEVRRTENNGLQNIVKLLRPLPKRFGVSNGDLLHVAGILGVMVCPGGPPIETWIGRPEAKNRAPEGLIPNVESSVPVLLDRFVDMSFNTRDTMALIGAHTTATQRFVDPDQAGKSQDSTPDIWDVRFYGETKNRTTPHGVFKFESDVKFSRHPLSKREFERFVDDQDDWDEDYSKAHEQMSLLGQDKNKMIRCTEILPPKIDLGPLFVDKDAGEESEDEDADPEYPYSRRRLRGAMLKLRGFWGFS